MKLSSALIILVTLTIAAVYIPTGLERVLALYEPEAMPSPTAPQVNPADIEMEVWQQINQRRELGGIRKLHLNSTCTRIARLRSRDMADRQYLDHYDPQTGELLLAQLLGQFKRNGGGENIFMIQGDNPDIASSAVTWWMQSRPHQLALLNPDFRATGVGVVVHGNQVYITQVFGYR